MNKNYFFIFAFILLLGAVSADFDYYDSSIDERYAQGGYISGWVELEFKDQDSGALFTDSFGNSVTLLDALKDNAYLHECENNCAISYSSSDPDTSKQITLKDGEEAIVGFVFEGRMDQVNSIEFNISSDVSQSVENQLEIDFFNDGEIDTGNTNAGDTSSLVDYSCFDKDYSGVGEIEIESIAYCQKIELDISPGFEVGAWVKESVAGDANLFMEIYDSYGDRIDSCKLNKTEQDLSQGEEIFCDIDYFVTEKNEYYVCLYSDAMGGLYKTQGYSSLDSCGFQSSPDPSQEEVASYRMGVKRKNFGTIDNVQIKDYLPNNDDLSQLIEDYLWDNYGGGYCLVSPFCTVPVKFISNKDQTITLNDLTIGYDQIGLSGKTSHVFYNVEEVSPLINSERNKFYLNNLFPVGTSLGDKTYTLDFDGEEILRENIVVEDLEIYLSPLVSAVDFPTTYKISSASINATRYEWDFGAGPELTFTNEKEYTFDAEGNYTVTVSIIDNQNQKFTETFDVIVEAPAKMINSRLNEFNGNLLLLKSQIDGFDYFEKEQVENFLNLTLIEDTINQIKTLKDQTGKEKETIDLILNLEVPLVLKSSGNKLPYFPNVDLIDPEIVKTVTGSSEDGGNKLGDAAASWAQQNLEVRASKREFSKTVDGSSTHLVTIFEIDSTEKEPIEENYYFIIEDLDGLEFLDDSSFQDGEGYKYMEVQGDVDIIFSTSEDLEINELPAYFTTSIEKLPALKMDFEEVQDKRMTILFLVFAGLVLIGIVIYIVLQRWYKIKYEKYLFKDRNYLFNMITYVNNAKKQGLDNDAIKKNLKEVGWNQEQIRYVMRKYSGRNTGMYEIPVKKIVKKKEEIVQKKQAKQAKTGFQGWDKEKSNTGL